ncbi:uncharacterized protein [Triticum aestivum]|uniref:uncharacterized protein n=1 Tax=Triticum aestivum TaxID=4565 RepID=UPI001D02B20F|nr:uncharacterized protein LOC123086667 [Triticum aestivum]
MGRHPNLPPPWTTLEKITGILPRHLISSQWVGLPDLPPLGTQEQFHQWLICDVRLSMEVWALLLFPRRSRVGALAAGVDYMVSCSEVCCIPVGFSTATPRAH